LRRSLNHNQFIKQKKGIDSKVEQRQITKRVFLLFYLFLYINLSELQKIPRNSTRIEKERIKKMTQSLEIFKWLVVKKKRKIVGIVEYFCPIAYITVLPATPQLPNRYLNQTLPRVSILS